MLTLLHDLTEFNWILENVTPFPRTKSEWQGSFVSHIVPNGFSDYCKIFHPMYIDAEYVNRPRLTWDEIGRNARKTKNNKKDSPQEKLSTISSVSSVSAPPLNFEGKRIQWQELAEKYGLKFHPEITNDTFSRRFSPRGRPRYLLGPNEGKLDEQTCQELIATLYPFTGDQPCFFEYFIMATRNVQNDFLYTGALNDVLETLDIESVYGSPTYWWPKDHSWCLCTDWDLTFTVLGGSKEVIDSILSSKEIEAVRVQETTRIDDYGDVINEKIMKKRIFARLQNHVKNWILRLRSR